MVVSEAQIKKSARKEWNSFVKSFYRWQVDNPAMKVVQRQQMEIYAHSFCELCSLLYTEKDKGWAYVYPFELV